MRDVSNHTFREALRGNIDLSQLPAELAFQVRSMWERLARLQRRVEKREAKQSSFMQSGLNGTRAVARRLRQIEAGSLRVQNGLVSL